jgi:hypothetical protein
MAKIRGIKPDFWTDDAIVDLGIPARLLFIGLWNFACDNGHLDDKPKQIKMRILPADDCDVNALLDELATHGRIIRANGTITIPKFAAHQKPHKTWWSTCDLPECTRPDDAPTRAVNRGATVANGSTTSDGDGDGDVKVSKPRGTLELNRRTPEHPIPEDWKPSEKHAELATAKGLDVAEQAFRFRNHALANDRRQRNWNAAFNTWLSKATDYAPAKPAQPSKAGEWWR